MRRRGRFDAGEDTPDGGNTVTAEEAAVAAAAADKSFLGHIGSRLGAALESLLPERPDANFHRGVLTDIIWRLCDGRRAFLAADANCRYTGIVADLEKIRMLLTYLDRNYYYSTLKTGSGAWVALNLLAGAWALVIYVVNATRCNTSAPLEEMPDDKAKAMGKYIAKACLEVHDCCTDVVAQIASGGYCLVDKEPPLTDEEREIAEQMGSWTAGTGRDLQPAMAAGDGGGDADAESSAVEEEEVELAVVS